ncbi:hypothetical protein ACHHYP_04271 [Achlya hypogyna]|uniref:Uncharacterized protein n=1 Tax=Achlya hypogyna TaxID=1202772 RepID=A0A1V9Z1R9_ACHHY|nr:hypothetical protein ACHHYP_04271 [Achlya hypogyna]
MESRENEVLAGAQAALAALIEEDHHQPLRRRNSRQSSFTTPDSPDSSSRRSSVLGVRTRQSSTVEVELPIEEEAPEVADAIGKAARRHRLASLRDAVSHNAPRISDLHRVSGVIKIDPKLRLVPYDRSALGEFQALLNAFPDTIDATAARIQGSMNELLHAIIAMMLDEQETLNHSKVARETAAHAMILFVSGLYDIATTGLSPGLADLLKNLAGRISALDAFVRSYFTSEAHELEQVVSSLEDSLEQAHAKITSLTAEVAAAGQLHKRKVAEMQLMAVVQQARARSQYSKIIPSALAMTTDSKLEETHHELLKSHQVLEDAHARLQTEHEVLLRKHTTAVAELEKLVRRVNILSQEVADLSRPMALSSELQQLRDELVCERRRVKELEQDVQMLRGKQIETTRGRIQRTSVVTRMRRQTELVPMSTSHEIANTATNILDEDSDEFDEADLPDISFETLMSKEPGKRLLCMLNYTLPGPPKTPAAMTQTPAAQALTLPVTKLKLHIEIEQPVGRVQGLAPPDVVGVRKSIAAVFERKRHLDECATMVHESRQQLVEVVVGYFLAKAPTPAVAQTEATVFLDTVQRLRPSFGDVRIFAEFLEGTHSDEALDFYVWLVGSLDQICVGVPLDARPEVHPQYISKFKATLLNRTLFRMLRFRTCGLANPSPHLSTHLQRHMGLDSMYDVQRLFEHITARGPIYLGEFHDLLDLFASTLDGDVGYPLDVYLYALVLMYKKQKDWFFEDARLLFNKVHEEALAFEARQRALEAVEMRQTEATKAKRKASELSAKPTKVKGKRTKGKKRRAATGDGRKTAVLTTVQFAVVLARLDTHLSFGQMTEMTVKVLSTRCFYSHGITFEAFAFTAQSLGWFRPNFAVLPPPLAEISISPEEKRSALTALRNVWDTHVAGIYVACECDCNPFVAKHVLQIKQRLHLALTAADDALEPVRTLGLLRHLLAVCWEVGAARGFRTRHGSMGHAYFSIAELARSDELLLVAKGILAIPDAVQGRQVFDANAYLAPPSDFLTNFSHIDPARIRDLFPDHCIQTNECAAIDAVLHRYAWQLNDVYRTYSLVCNDLQGITTEGFHELIHDLGLGSVHFTPVHMTLVFKGVVGRQPETDRLLATSFIELVIRLAVEKHTTERPFIDRKQSKLQLVRPERIAILLEDLCTRYLLPNICQNLSITFRRQVAAPELQRLLNKHRNLLRRLYLYYCRQDAADMEAWKMNFGEFETFIVDFSLNDPVFFPSSMNLLVFNACQDDLNEGQFIYQEFVTAIIAIAQMKDSNPFLKWQRKTSTFIQHLIDYISHPDRAVKFRLILS